MQALTFGRSFSLLKNAFCKFWMNLAKWFWRKDKKILVLHIYTKSYALFRESFAFICKSYAFIRKSYVFMQESFVFIRESFALFRES